MKTIKIFLASSEELTDDCNAFGNLVRRLDKIYEKRGIRIELFEWEDYDAAYNNRRKQDEYNDQIKASDMFLALFHTKAGKFTIEEFDIATEEFKKHASPKVYTYCKDLQEGELESPELIEFKQRLFEELGHYWCRYNNRDSMQLHFVMQLQLVETSGSVDPLKVEDGKIMLEGMPIAALDNLQFATGNEAYKKMSIEISSLPAKIDKARQRVEKFPDDEDLRDDLQQKLNRYNKLKKELTQLQKILFETAQRIAAMQLEQVSDMLRRAIEAFEEGNLERANTLLDEIGHEAEHHIVQLEQQRALVHQDIEAFMLQAKTVMADVSIPIDERIRKSSAIYARADGWAQKSALPDEKYETLLDDYGEFIRDYAQYDMALPVHQRLVTIKEKLYGMEHPYTATSYISIGIVYDSLGDYNQALGYYFKAMVIREKVLGLEHPSTAILYNNIGYDYNNLGDYDKALKYYSIALAISEKNLGLEHSLTATSYNNIGCVYDILGDYNKALEYYSKAQVIREKVLGLEHPDTAESFNNIGYVYDVLGEYDKALEYYFKDLTINEKVLGLEHPNTAISYNNIGGVYDSLGDYDKALKYYSKALAIEGKVLGMEHPDTAGSFNNIGLVYHNLGDYSKALEHYFKALTIYEKILGLEHTLTATSYNNIGGVYDNLGDYGKALEYFFKALAIQEKVLGQEHLSTATSYHNIGCVYESLGDYDKASKYYLKTLAIQEKFYDPEHPDTIASYNDVGAAYEGMGNNSKAIEYYSKALLVREKLYGEIHKETAKSYKNIGNVYDKQGNYTKALEFYSKALAIREKVLGLEHPDTKVIQEKIDAIKQIIE